MREFFRRLWYLLHRRQLDADLAEELEFHREMKASELAANGAAPAEADLIARRALGSAALAHDHSHDVWVPLWFQGLSQDLTFAARRLARDRTFTFTAVLVLGLGIAASTTVFTIVNAMFLRGLPAAHPDRIIQVQPTDKRGHALGLVSYQTFLDWRSGIQPLASLAAFRETTLLVGSAGQSPERIRGSFISANAFELIGVAPTVGREFQTADDQPGAPAVVILGPEIWRRRFGADPKIVGRTIRVNGSPSTVIGVMPVHFAFPNASDIWEPLAQMPGLAPERRDVRTIALFGTLADGASLERAQAKMATVTNRLAHDYPESDGGLRAAVMPFTGGLTTVDFMPALLGAVGLLLLIACANVGNLLLARAAPRAPEMALRASLGAGRWRMLRQLLVENVLLAVLAGAAGLALSVAGVHVFASTTAGIAFPYWWQFTIDRRVLAFIGLISFATVIIFGVLPALHGSRADLNGVLKSGGATGVGGRRTTGWASVLLAVELTLTLVLLTGAGLMMRSLAELNRVDHVIDSSRILMAGLTLPSKKYTSSNERSALYQEVEDRLKAAGDSWSATVASAPPYAYAGLQHLAIEGAATATEGRQLPAVNVVTIDSQYFTTLGLKLLRGRPFDDLDGLPGHQTAIVNKLFADRFFPRGDALGHRIRLMDPTPHPAMTDWATIVGIAPTVRETYLTDLLPVVYLPNRANPPAAAWLLVRGPGDPAAIAPTVRRAVFAVDPAVPLFAVIPLGRFMAEARWIHTTFGLLFTVFALIALLLSAVGVYAITAYTVVQRTHEIGVRVALGARASQVVGMFIRQRSLPLASGVVLGLLGAFGLGRFLTSLLVRTSATDPVTLTGVAVLLILVALLACLLPASRAARTEPVIALRHE